MVITDFHCLRPWWLLCLLPLLGLIGWLWRQTSECQAWNAVCDSHLLAHLMRKQSSMKNNGVYKRKIALLLFFMGGVLMILSLSGPSWLRLPVPTFHTIQPRVLILDMSQSMLVRDLTPNRLTRAKFKLQDLLSQRDKGQFGLVVFTGEPFIVSPLTEDGNTIIALLQMLTPDIMPVGGQQLDRALNQAAQLINEAGYTQGQLLVLTGSIPDVAAVTMAEKLANRGIVTSVMPIVADETITSLFQPLAAKGNGVLLALSDTSKDLEQWLTATRSMQKVMFSRQDNIPLWRDEGRWFLFPALILLLPIFRRGWLQRIDS